MMLVQKKQHTVTRDKQETELIARGRHDPCVVPRGLAENDTLPYSLLIILVCLSIMKNSILTGLSADTANSADVALSRHCHIGLFLFGSIEIPCSRNEIYTFCSKR